MMGASHILCLFSWPVTLFFIISGDYMLQGSVLIWHHQVARIEVELRSWFVWHPLPSNIVIGPICLWYMSLSLRGENCHYNLTLLDGAQIQQTYFEKSMSHMLEGVNCFVQKNSWYATELKLGLLKPIMKRTFYLWALALIYGKNYQIFGFSRFRIILSVLTLIGKKICKQDEWCKNDAKTRVDILRSFLRLGVESKWAYEIHLGLIMQSVCSREFNRCHKNKNKQSCQQF